MFSEGRSPSRRRGLRSGPREAPSVAVALLVALSPAAASAQTEPACPPTVVIDPSVPARVATRLRALETLLSTDGPCSPSRLRFAMNAERLTVEVSLDDGRVANRTLRSLDDALPTLLAVLAAPPPALAPSEPRPAPEPPAEDDAPPSPTPAAPPRITPIAPPPVGVRPFAQLDLGVRWAVRDTALGGARLSLGALGERWRVGAAATFSGGAARDGRGSTDPRGAGGLGEIEAVASGAAQWRLGRWTLEPGAFVGAAWQQAWARRERVGARVALRVGVEFTALYRFASAWSVSATATVGAEPWAWRAEGATNVDDPLRPSPVVVGLGVGVRWGGGR
ncbi:MAG: hypothetical protein R3A52_08970 [Polyangiales bacterium]